MTALFGFTSIFVGAALAWSLALLGSLAHSAATVGVPPQQVSISLVIGGFGLLVAVIGAAWLYVFWRWVAQLPKLRLLTFTIIALPFAFGFLTFGLGTLSVIIP
ncbi:MAG: hypothetical protein EON87_21565 [Brevundimonas sp.]|nr:MAG: hypothetical protein EON87_21565 [Brevundimonas sp.]